MSSKHQKVVYRGGGSDSVYGLGMIGAWIFYIGRARTPRERALGFFKGLVWPAMMVYEILKFFSDDLPVLIPPKFEQPVQTSEKVQLQASKPAPKSKSRSATKPVRISKPRTKKSTRK